MSYLISLIRLGFLEPAAEFNRLRSASTLPGSHNFFPVRWRMIYYCCLRLSITSGPREIRTLDLLNAIETRSQLRYGPIQHPSGPGGIRTLDLISAIDARSQLRYRPIFQGSRILPSARYPVKRIGEKYIIGKITTIIS
jgi:hypothetical protein